MSEPILENRWNAMAEPLQDRGEPAYRAWYEGLLERDLVPDVLVRAGIRRLLGQRLADESRGGVEAELGRKRALVASLKKSAIALQTRAANRQHYEVPTEFFQAVLGRRLKYSCAYWTPDTRSLDEAEEAMLALTCERARVADGQRILELGCGWGSLTLYAAERYPDSAITAVSNSRTQREFIESEAKRRGLRNVRVVTADMNEFCIRDRFDRVVSVEMLEHMRNYEALFARVASWLDSGGLFFTHVFAHKHLAYPFEARDESDWMAQHFFSGGLMPSEDLFSYFSQDLQRVDRWRVSGVHYQKTAEAWLAQMDRRRAEVLPLFASTYGKEQALQWWVRWRIFFMACAEMWGYRGGTEWIVSHSLFEVARRYS